MNVAEDFEKLPTWGKVGAVGAVASLLGLIVVFFHNQSAPTGQQIDLGTILGQLPGSFVANGGGGSSGVSGGGLSTDPGTPITNTPTQPPPTSTPITAPAGAAAGPIYNNHPIYPTNGVTTPHPATPIAPVMQTVSAAPAPVYNQFAAAANVTALLASQRAYAAGQSVGQAVAAAVNQQSPTNQAIRGIQNAVAFVLPPLPAMSAANSNNVAHVPTPMQQTRQTNLRFQAANDYIPMTPVVSVQPAPYVRPTQANTSVQRNGRQAS